MSDTPRTDRNYIRGFEALMSHTKDEDEWVRADFARQLERELRRERAVKTELLEALEALADQFVDMHARVFPSFKVTKNKAYADARAALAKARQE